MELSPVLLCVWQLTYYRLNVWTEGLTRPGISVWTCSASTTLSVGSGDRSAVCKSYQKTLWCLHPVDEDRKSADKGTEHESNSTKAAAFSTCGSKREKQFFAALYISQGFKSCQVSSFFFLHLSTFSSTIFHLNRKKYGLLLFLKP